MAAFSFRFFVWKWCYHPKNIFFWGGGQTQIAIFINWETVCLSTVQSINQTQTAICEIFTEWELLHNKFISERQRKMFFFFFCLLESFSCPGMSFLYCFIFAVGFCLKIWPVGVAINRTAEMCTCFLEPGKERQPCGTATVVCQQIQKNICIDSFTSKQHYNVCRSCTSLPINAQSNI